MSASSSVPCPICFESASTSWKTQKARYFNGGSHSWTNTTLCDAHDICWSCLAQHIEVQVLDLGMSLVRCPGIKCRHHLLDQDIDYALWECPRRDDIIETLQKFRSGSCQDRLKEMVYGKLEDGSGSWLLEETQPCPSCLVLARRETGCNHIHCRCGQEYHFCCGAPTNHWDEWGGCICPYLEREGNMTFAAWLRSDPSSTCSWLLEESTDVSAHFVSTLGFWLWMAGADISAPGTWDGVVAVQSDSILPPLRWKTEDAVHHIDLYDFFLDDFFLLDFFFETVQDEQDCAGHLRKEVYSMETRRTLRRRLRRPEQASEAACADAVSGSDTSLRGNSSQHRKSWQVRSDSKKPRPRWA